MKNSKLVLFIGSTCAIAACSTPPSLPLVGDNALTSAKETRISNIRQLTFEGVNAQAYWSPDQKWLTFQHVGEDNSCEQVFRLSLDGREKHLLSGGKGRAADPVYSPKGDVVLFSSTLAGGSACPREADRGEGVTGTLNRGYQFYRNRASGDRLVAIEPGAPRAYNAELATCRDGKVAFTSDRGGDLDLYVGRIDVDGMIRDAKPITSGIGYDGGASFSTDCSRIAWRASRPRPGTEMDEYRAGMRAGQLKIGALEIWIANADGTNSRQLTKLGATSSAPTFTPDGARVLFSSNFRQPGTKKFDLFLVRTNGTEIEQVTFSGGYDGTPSFSPDGRFLAFTSTRFARHERDVNVFVADWNAYSAVEKLLDQDPQAPNRVFAVVRELSSSDLEGRGALTKGLDRAETYVSDLFERLELKTFADTFGANPAIKDYDHALPILKGASADWSGSSLKADWKALKAKEDFAPASFSSEKKFVGEVVDVGYGLVIPERRLDEYAGKNVRGKIVLIKRGVPAGLGLTAAQSANYRDLRYRAYLARDHKAAGVLYWDPEVTDAGSETLSESLSDSTFTAIAAESGIPAFFLAKRLATDFIDSEKTVRVSGVAKLNRDVKSISNVIGVIGSRVSCAARRPIVLGAHLDGLGMGGSTSLDGAIGRIQHPGADANASGIAALIEIARKLQGSTDACYILAAFNGEEIGLVGSSKFAELLHAAGIHPRAMINLDTIGRLRDGKLYAFGTETAPEWKKILSEECPEHAVTCVSGSGAEGYLPSDHVPFYLSDVPVLRFFTGPTADFHRSTDTVDKINPIGVLQIADVVMGVAKRAARGGLTFTRVKGSPKFKAVKLAAAPVTPAAVGAPSAGNPTAAAPEASDADEAAPEKAEANAGPKVGYLGTVPDLSTMADPEGAGRSGGGGVQLKGARVGSPAEKAGVHAADIIVGITVLDEEPGVALAEKKTYDIDGLPDYRTALAQVRPGIRVRLRVRRGKRVEEFTMTAATPK